MTRLSRIICITIVAMVLHGGPGASAADFGAKVGVTVADQRTNAPVVSDARLGLRVGCFSRWQVMPNLHVTAEAAYTQRGATNARLVAPNPNPEVPPNPSASSTSHQLGYITIPLVADLGVRAGRTELFAGAGPRLDILVVDSFTSREHNDALSPYYDEFARFVAGGSVVGGIRLNEARVSLEVQYNWDWTDSYSVSDEYYFRSRALDVLLGFTF